MDRNITNNAPTTKIILSSQVYENPTYSIVDLGKGDDVITGSAGSVYDGDPNETPGVIGW